MPRDFKTVLCPTDFSEESCRAIEYGARFAQSAQGSLLLVHIVHMPSEPYRNTKGQIVKFDDLRVDAQLKLQELRQKLTGDYEHCELIIEVGDPFEHIISIAEKRAADLITIGTHDHSGIGHFLSSSIGEKIIEHAPCPVFVLRRGVL